MAKEAVKTAAKAAPEKPVKKEKTPEIKYVTSREIADKLGIKPATLRRYLRSLPMFQDEGYTRYKFDPSSKEDMQKVKDITDGYAKYAKSEDAKKKERLEGLKKKGDTKKAKGKAKDEDVEEDVEEETDEEESDDEI